MPSGAQSAKDREQEQTEKKSQSRTVFEFSKEVHGISRRFDLHSSTRPRFVLEGCNKHDGTIRLIRGPLGGAFHFTATIGRYVSPGSLRARRVWGPTVPDDVAAVRQFVGRILAGKGYAHTFVGLRLNCEWSAAAKTLPVPAQPWNRSVF